KCLNPKESLGGLHHYSSDMRTSSLAKYQRYYHSYDHDIFESMSLKKTIDIVIMDRDRSMKVRQTGRGTYSPTLSEDAPQSLEINSQL
ncbi:Hypothetical predicted protein, partial [Olea europaea subsp. europaea]